MTNCLGKSAQLDFFLGLLGIAKEFLMELLDDEEAIPLLVALHEQEFELAWLQSLDLLRLDD